MPSIWKLNFIEKTFLIFLNSELKSLLSTNEEINQGFVIKNINNIKKQEILIKNIEFLFFILHKIFNFGGFLNNYSNEIIYLLFLFDINLNKNKNKNNLKLKNLNF